MLKELKHKNNSVVFLIKFMIIKLKKLVSGDLLNGKSRNIQSRKINQSFMTILQKPKTIKKKI